MKRFLNEILTYLVICVSLIFSKPQDVYLAACVIFFVALSVWMEGAWKVAAIRNKEAYILWKAAKLGTINSYSEYPSLDGPEKEQIFII